MLIHRIKYIVVVATLLSVACFSECSEHGDTQLQGIDETTFVFENGDVSLTGWLRVPVSDHRVPVVVFLSSSGNTRGKNEHYLYVSSHLNQAGIGVFLYDKRGVGASTGQWESSSFFDLAGDGLAAVELIKDHPSVDPEAIGLWGISQGGWLGPLVASQSDDVSFVIMVSGPAVSPMDQKLFQTANQYRNQGLNENELTEAITFLELLHVYLGNPVNFDEVSQALDVVKAKPWFQNIALEGLGPNAALATPSYIESNPQVFRYFREDAPYDPIPPLLNTKVPLLALYGARDVDVPIDTSIHVLDSIMSQNGNDDLTIHIFEDANHPMLAPGGNPYVENYAETMTQWVTERFQK